MARLGTLKPVIFTWACMEHHRLSQVRHSLLQTAPFSSEKTQYLDMQTRVCICLNADVLQETKEVFKAAGGRLKVVGRAGDGIDNVDLASATDMSSHPHHGNTLVS